jgi:hypothetical protein
MQAVGLHPVDAGQARLLELVLQAPRGRTRGPEPKEAVVRPVQTAVLGVMRLVQQGSNHGVGRRFPGDG